MTGRSCYHICPLCGAQLAIKSTRHGNIFNCPSCQGAMANLPVLKGRVGHGPVSHFWQTAIIYGKASKKECPICRRPMMMFAANPGLSPFSLEICKQCRLIWFDKHSFEEMPSESEQVRKGMVQEMALVDLKLNEKVRAAERNMDLAIRIAEGLSECLS